MKQKTLDLDLKTRRKRKQVLIDEMERVMPWHQLQSLIAQHAP